MKYEEILNKGLNEPQTVGVINPYDSSTIEAINQVLETSDQIQFKLYGQVKSMSHFKENSNEQVEIYLYDHDEDALKACFNDLKLGHFDVLMKGLIETKSLLKQVINKEYNLIESGQLLSHIALFDILTYEKPIWITDCAMNLYPDLDAKKRILDNTLESVFKVGYDNICVGILSATETVNPKLQSSVDADQLAKEYIDNEHIHIDGPLALDIAINKHAIEQKNLQLDTNGACDVLLVPSLDVGNVLYKSLIYFANANVSGILVGAKHPIVLTSRADSAQDKFNSLRLALSVQ